MLLSRLRGMLQDIRDMLMDNENLVEHYVRKEGLTPLDVLVEQESRLEIIMILENIQKYLDPIDRKILEMWAVDGYNQADIGIALSLTQQAVSYRIKVMHLKIKRHICEIPYFDLYYSDEVLTEKPYLGHNQKILLGFPHEHLMKLSDGGRWGERKGTKVYISKVKCTLPEYFQGAFGDNKTQCTLCKKCKRRSAFVDQRKTIQPRVCEIGGNPSSGY